MQKQQAASLLQVGRIDDARNILIGICADASWDVDAWDMLGAACSMLGMYAEAEKSFRRVIKLSSGNFKAHNNLGTALRAQGKSSDALSEYDKAIRINPQYVKAHVNRGGVLQEVGEIDEALASHKRASKLAPNDAEIHVCLAHLYRNRSDLDNALRHYQQALCAAPKMVDAVLGVVDIYKAMRRDAEAFAVLDPLIREVNGATSGRLALSYSRLCRHTGRYDEGIDMLERIKASCNIQSENDRAEVSFGLGELYDARGDYQNAFINYQLGNQLRVIPCKGDTTSSEERCLRESLAVFTPQFLERAPRARNTAETPIFIIGMPRSGTSLVEQILCSHPAVYGAGELTLLSGASTELWKLSGSNQHYPKFLSANSRAHFDRVANRYLDTTRRLAGGTGLRITDKMPGNYWYCGLIYLLFPRARIIHCTRDPLDTCLSIYFQNFSVGHEYTKDLRSVGRVYGIYRKLMAHWRQVLEYPMLDIRYEELVGNQEDVTRRLVEFCDLPWDERCLRFQDNPRIVLTASHDQVRRPIYTSSRQRWKNYRPFIGELMDELHSAGVATECT